MKKALLVILVALAAFTSKAQLAGVELDVFVEHDGVVGTTDLTGFTTYRLYAVLTNPNDFLSAIYGQYLEPMAVTTTTTFYQNAFGSSLGSTINPDFYGFAPELQYDSWVTIGRESNVSAGTAIFTAQAAADPWLDNFAAGNDIVINGLGGSWFTLFQAIAVQAYPDANLRVLIGQFTTDGDITGCINAQVFVNGVQADDQNGIGFSFTTIEGAVLGCTIPDACNYNPIATVNDGSCVSPSCTNPLACNYLPFGACDTGTCLFFDECGNCGGNGLLGCINPLAYNFDPEAGCDDGSCILQGCTNPLACNFNPEAGFDDGTCLFFDECGNCGGSELTGCTDDTACNYSPDASCDNNTCTFPGCTDPSACNFDPSAGCDDGSCLFFDECGNCGGSELTGCIDDTACNYSAIAACDDGSCSFPGCNDEDACNYNPLAACYDENTCFFSDDCGSQFTSCNQTYNFGNIPSGIAPNWSNSESLPFGCVGWTYTGAIHLQVPGSLSDLGLGFPNWNAESYIIDSLSIGEESLQSIGLTYECGSCQVNPGGQICIALNGVPSVAGLWEIDVNITVFFTIFGITIGQPFTQNVFLSIDECAGCTFPSACNYAPEASIDDGSCLFFDPCGICGGSSITGCTNPAACNYAPDAACDDGSCSFPGCTNQGSVNFNPLAGCDDGSCIPTFGSFEINAPGSMLYSDTLEIEVVVTGGQNLYGLFATLNYDTQRFAFVGSTLGDYLGADVLASPPVDAGGSIEFGASKLGQQPGSNGDGWFYTLRFVPISPNLGNPVFVDFSVTASDAFNALGTSGQLFLPETHTVELIFEAEVWPGDLNHDGIVSVADILPIGYFYNITGPARPNASLAWEGQNCPIWGTGASFQGDGFYRVFADGNGDGVINLADQVAVGFNINQTVSLDLLMPNLEMLATTQSTGVVVPIANAVSPDQISIPETESITALFTATTAAGNAESLFGFTMSIDFSSLGILASEVEVDFTVSEFGVLNQTMIAQAYGQGSQLDLAITRTTPNTTVGEITLFAITLPLPTTLSAGDYNLPVTIGSANDPIGQTALLSAQNIQFSVSSPFGCADNAACNYNPGATLDDGSCLIIGDACDDGNANTINDVITTNCECAGETIGDAVLGCTEADACNYNPQATQDDGSCEYVELYAINGPVGPSAFSTIPYSYTSTAGSTYAWTVTNGVLAGGQGTSEVEVIWSSQGSGSVSVTETDIDDCTGATVTLDVVVLPTNIAELAPQSISIYPNPAQTWFRVELPENFVGARIELFALTGQLLGSTQLIARSQQVDVSHLTNGMYLVHVYLPSGRSVQRLSVAR